MTGITQDVTLGGRYRLVQRIASGGMGTVWRAEDTVLHRPVAVKILSDALGHDARFVERFRREAQAAAGLSHPNVAGVYDYGEDGDTPYMVMELIAGETLAERLHREGRLPPEEAARIAFEIAMALQAAHEAGLVHRDVKPGNVMITPRGEVKVMDFGIAAAAWAAPLTATGTTIGTASYLSPEQASGERATPASDVYALGCVLHEMLIGRPPFTGSTPVAVAAAHIHERPRAVRDLDPGIPASLATACDMALAKDPAARPASARILAQMLSGDVMTSVPIVPTPPDANEAGRATAAVGPTTPVAPGSTEVLPPPDRTARLAPLPAALAEDMTPKRSRTRTPRAVWIALIVMLLSVALIAGILAAFTGGSASPHNGNSTTGPAKVDVPAVVGLRLQKALDELTASGLGVGSIVKVEQGPNGVVVRIDPPAGTRLAQGDSVTLYVGGGHGPGEDHGHPKKKGGD